MRRAGGADRVAERDRAAVDVDLLLVDAEHPDRVEGDRGEGLVDLPEVDVLGRAGRPSRARAWRPSPASSPGRRSRRRPCRSATIVRERPACRWRSAHSSEATTIAPAPSLTPGELPAVWVASSPPIALQLGERLQRWCRGGSPRRPRPWISPFATLDRDADDLVGEAALVGRLGGQLVRADGEAVQVGAGDLELVADLARLVDHLLLGEGVGQPVVGHRVDRLDVAHAEAEAGARAAGRAPGDIDSMPPLTATSTSPARIAWSSEPDRAHAGGADLVDRLRGDLLGDPALDLRLARGDLALAGLEHLAEDDRLDLLGSTPERSSAASIACAAEFGARRARRARRPSSRTGCGRCRGSLYFGMRTGLLLDEAGRVPRES